jgi:putative transposase
LLAIGGTHNHVHLLLALPPGRSISDVMRDIKANSSRFIRTTSRLFAWQDGYAAVSVSPSQTSTVKVYIANQEEHHPVRRFEDEYLALLKRSGAKFDPDDFLG